MESATDLDSLAAVAAQVGNGESEVIAAAAAVPVSTEKRARKASAVEMARRKLDEKQRALLDAEASVQIVEAKGALATAAEKKKAARKILVIDEQRRALVTATKWLAAKVQEAADDAVTAAAKEAAKAEREQVTRAMTEEGVMLLCEIRIKYQLRFDNSADASNAIWERIHHDFQEKGRASLPASDYERGVPALKSIWQKYYGEAKLWSAKAQRDVSLSGVPADEVEEKVVEHYNVTSCGLAAPGWRCMCVGLR